MKKLINFILIIALFLSPALGSVRSEAAYDSLMPELGIMSECICLQSLDNDTVIFSKNADLQTHPASLTKIVTAAVVLEHCDNLEQTVTVRDDCIHQLDGTGSSMGGLKADEVISINNLLHYMLIHSANEAAIVLADYVGGGDINTFVTMMNDLVAKIGCENSHFANPHGLDDDNQYTTANDMAAIMRYAMQYDVFADIVSNVTYTVPATNKNKEKKLYNTNFLMNGAYKEYYCKYVTGGKTGSTEIAGKCVVATASNDGYSYIAIALKAPFEDIDKDGYKENGAFIDCKKMFEWAFKNLRLVSVSDKNKIIAEVPVKLSWSTDYVTLSPKEESYELVPLGTNAGSLLIVPDEKSMPKSINAPVKKGQTVCTAKVMYAGEAIAEVELVANADVHRSFILLIGSLIKKLFSSWVTKIILVAAIIALVFWLLKRRNDKRARFSASNVVVLNRSDFRGFKK